jgi:hypothetical protein
MEVDGWGKEPLVLLIAMILVLWALVCAGVVVLCVAARRADQEIAREQTITAARTATNPPLRALSRFVSP